MKIEICPRCSLFECHNILLTQRLLVHLPYDSSDHPGAIKTSVAGPMSLQKRLKH